MATSLGRNRHASLGRAQGRAGDGSTRVEFLEFTLAGESYAVEIAWITEILKPLPITLVPRSAPEILGVMSVRGRLVTVLDLRRRLHHPPADDDTRARILLVHAGEDEVIGLRVDEVVQVHRLSDADIEPAAVLGGDQPAHIGGIGRTPSSSSGADGRVLVLIDIRPIVGAS